MLPVIILGLRNNWYQSYNSTITEIGAQKPQSGPIAWPNALENLRCFCHPEKNKVDFTGYPSNHFSGCRLNGCIIAYIFFSRNLPKLDIRCRGNVYVSPNNLINLNRMTGMYCLG